MGQKELIEEAFGYLNSFKRHRSLQEIKKHDKMYHELQMYKMVDQLELALRAIKKDVCRSTNNTKDESSDD